MYQVIPTFTYVHVTYDASSLRMHTLRTSTFRTSVRVTSVHITYVNLYEYTSTLRIIHHPSYRLQSAKTAKTPLRGALKMQPTIRPYQPEKNDERKHEQEQKKIKNKKKSRTKQRTKKKTSKKKRNLRSKKIRKK